MNMNKSLLKLALVFALVSMAFICHSQTTGTMHDNSATDTFLLSPDKISSQLFWVMAGGGVSTIGPSVQFTASYRYKKSVISMRNTISWRRKKISLKGAAKPPEKVWDAGLLFGRSNVDKKVTASLSAGIGLTRGTRRGEFTGCKKPEYSEKMLTRWEAFDHGLGCDDQFEDEKFNAVGFLMQAEISYKKIGMLAFANYNKEQSFLGVSLSYVLGKIN